MKELPGYIKIIGDVVYTPAGPFTLGELVYYDVFPHGRNIPGIVTERGIEAQGKWREYFEREGVATYCEWEFVDDARKVPDAPPAEPDR